MLRLIGALSLGFLLLIAFTPLPELLSQRMSVRGRPEPADAIVILGGGGVRPDGTLADTSMRRTLYGMQLYRRGLAPLLVLSGPASAGRQSEAVVRADLARQCAIPPSAILTAPLGRTTREESVRIVELLRSRGIRKILLVADAQGMGRAMGAFERVGFEVLPAPTGDVSDLGGSPESRLQLMRQVVVELVAWPIYWVSGYL